MNHTPGPWEANHVDWKGEPSQHRVYISGDKHENYPDEDDDDQAITWSSTGIAIVEGNATSQNVTRANASLIAASPDLLRALERILEIGKRDMSNPKYDGYFNYAREAVAKALGKEQS